MTLANGEGCSIHCGISVSVMSGETGSVSFSVVCNRWTKNVCIVAKYKQRNSRRAHCSYLGLLCWVIAAVEMKSYVESVVQGKGSLYFSGIIPLKVLEQ